MVVQKIIIQPLDSGCVVELWANNKKSKHCFSKATDAIDFITAPLITTEKRGERGTKGQS